MALHRNVTVDEVNCTAHFADITTGTPAAFTAAVIKGDVIGVTVTKYATTAGTATIITPAINGTTITGGAVTVAVGTGASTTQVLITNPGLTGRVLEGDTIRFLSDGGSNDGTVPAMATVTVRPRRS